MKHKHSELIKQWADGAQIQYRLQDGSWYELAKPKWSSDAEYRIKPEPKPDIVQTCEVSISFASFKSRYPTVQFTFDGETGKLKSAEVML